MNTLLLENNLNIEQNSVKHFTDNTVTDNKKDFSDVLNSKKTNQTSNTKSKDTKKESNTLGDVKNNTKDEQRANKIANFISNIDKKLE